MPSDPGGVSGTGASAHHVRRARGPRGGRAPPALPAGVPLGPRPLREGHGVRGRPRDRRGVPGRSGGRREVPGRLRGRLRGRPVARTPRARRRPAIPRRGLDPRPHPPNGPRGSAGRVRSPRSRRFRPADPAPGRRPGVGAVPLRPRPEAASRTGDRALRDDPRRSRASTPAGPRNPDGPGDGGGRCAGPGKIRLPTLGRRQAPWGLLVRVRQTFSPALQSPPGTSNRPGWRCCPEFPGRRA